MKAHHGWNVIKTVAGTIDADTARLQEQREKETSVLEQRLKVAESHSNVLQKSLDSFKADLISERNTHDVEIKKLKNSHTAVLKKEQLQLVALEKTLQSAEMEMQVKLESAVNEASQISQKEQKEQAEQAEAITKSTLAELDMCQRELFADREKWSAEKKELDDAIRSAKTDHEENVQSISASFQAQIKGGDGQATESNRLMEELQEQKGLVTKFKSSVTKLEKSSSKQKKEQEEKTKKINKLTSDLKSSEDGVSSSKKEIAVLQKEINVLNSANSELRTQIEGPKKDISVDLTVELSSAKSDLLKLQEVITERERALESASGLLAEAQERQSSYESAEQRMSDNILSLEKSVKEKDEAFDSFRTQTRDAQVISEQSAIALAGASTKESELLLQLKEKSLRITNFQEEGTKLAKRQNEMEKLVRQTKSEYKSKDAEIERLKASQTALEATVVELRANIKKTVGESSEAAKNAATLQAVSLASVEKLDKLECELNTKKDELLSTKKSLDASWVESKELKRQCAELKAEMGDMTKQLGDNTNKVELTQSSIRDTENRENVLRATNSQLQDSLQRHMSESSAREERLREELGETRKRWQDAVTSREALSAEMTTSAAPLLQQISSLQDLLRSKSEGWNTVESSLSERAIKAEGACEVSGHKREIAEERASSLQLQLDNLAIKYVI